MAASNNHSSTPSLSSTVVMEPTPQTVSSTPVAAHTNVAGAKLEVIDQSSADSTTESSPKALEEPKGFLAKLSVMRNRAPKSLMLYTVCLAQFIDIVNGASMAIALLSIATDLKFAVSQMQWIVSAYGLAFAGLLLVAGRIGDLFGHRRVFLCGLSWFGIWALIVSFSTSPVMFCIARALQGMGAAFTIPTALALITTNYAVGPERTKALSMFGAFGALGAVLGILLAGGMISSLGWQWIFRFSAILVAILWFVGFAVIPETPPKAVRPKIDFGGAITATLGITAFVYYISSSVDEGWGSVKTVPVLAAGVVCFAIFFYIQAKISYPIMPFRVWRHRYFSSSFIVIFLLQAAFQGILYYVNLIFQQVYGWGSMKTAAGFIVHSVLAVVVFTVLGRTLPRLPLKPFILAAFVLRAISALMFSFIKPDTSYFALAFPALIVHVFGIGFSMLPVQITALKDARNEDQGIVGALYNVGLQVGAPFGLAILTVISGRTNEGLPPGPALMAGYKNAMYGIIGFCVVGFFAALILIPNDKAAAKKVARKAAEAEAAASAAGSQIEADVESAKIGRPLSIAEKEELELQETEEAEASAYGAMAGGAISKAEYREEDEQDMVDVKQGDKTELA